MVSNGKVVYPGSKVGNANTAACGRGTYTRGNEIFASVSGVTQMETSTSSNNSSATRTTTIHIETKKVLVSQMVLAVDDVVTCVVKRINNRQAFVDIKILGDIVLHESMSGVIQKEDVRLTDIDSVEMEKIFQPQQIVRATVRSYGNSRSYYLSTAKAGMGVIDRKAAVVL